MRRGRRGIGWILYIILRRRDRNFNRIGDITYIATEEGWRYLAVVGYLLPIAYELQQTSLPQLPTEA